MSVDWWCKSSIVFSVQQFLSQWIVAHFPHFHGKSSMICMKVEVMVFWVLLMFGFLFLTSMTFEHVKTWHITACASYMYVNTGIYVYMIIYVWRFFSSRCFTHSSNRSLCVAKYLNTSSVYYNFLCWKKNRKRVPQQRQRKRSLFRFSSSKFGTIHYYVI